MLCTRRTRSSLMFQHALKFQGIVAQLMALAGGFLHNIL